MKYLILLLCLSTSVLIAQSSFETAFMEYQPTQRADISDKDFNFGKRIISETKAAILADDDGFNIADYWNICTAFIKLGESALLQQQAFDKFLQSNRRCEYLVSMENKSLVYKHFTAQYIEALTQCQATPTQQKALNLKEYCKQYGLDISVVERIAQIQKMDMLYRKSDYLGNEKQQKQLDIENQKAIEALFRKYERYVGEDIVGPEFSATMWLVIQHSNLQMMEFYLPHISNAVAENQLNLVPLKMLIDRVYTIKTGKQIFGSQIGVEIVDETLREQIRKQYKIN